MQIFFLAETVDRSKRSKRSYCVNFKAQLKGEKNDIVLTRQDMASITPESRNSIRSGGPAHT